VIDPEGKPTAQQADPESPYSSPEEAAEGPNNKQILADQSDGKTMSSVSVRRVEELADARTDEELLDVFRRDDGFVTPKMVDFDDDAFVPLDEDLPVEEAMAKAMGKPLPPSLKAAKFNMNEFIYADPKPGGSSSGAIYFHKPSGKKYLIKMYDNPDQAVNEVIANRFYTDAMQLNNVPRMDLVRDGDTVYLASEYIEDLVQSPTVPDNSAAYFHLGRVYPVSAFLQDNDIVGMDKSNIQFLASPSSVTIEGMTTFQDNFISIPIDHGGSLFFKAMGAPKPYTADDSALTTYMDDAFDPASFFNNHKHSLHQDSFNIGAEEAFEKIEKLYIPTFIDSLKKEGLQYKDHSLDDLQKTMQKRQSLFSQFAANKSLKNLYKSVPEHDGEQSQLTENLQNAMDKALVKEKQGVSSDSKKYEETPTDDDDLIIDAQVSPNKEIKKFTQKAESLGYNSGFLVIRNDTYGKGLMQLSPPLPTLNLQDTQLSSQLGRQILPEDATLSLKTKGSDAYGDTIYSGVFLNGNGFYKNVDDSSEFTLSEFADGRLGFAVAYGTSPKAFFQAGKSLAMDNPKSFLGVDLPEEVDLVELAILRKQLQNAAKVQLPGNKVAESTIDHILTNSYGAAPTGIVTMFDRAISIPGKGFNAGPLKGAHEKLTGAIKKDSTFKYPRMNYSGLHPQGYQEYKSVYSNKYAKFFGRPFEIDGQDGQLSLGKANITPEKGKDFTQSEGKYAQDISAVLKELNKNAKNSREAYISYPVIDELNSRYPDYTNSQNDVYSNGGDSFGPLFPGLRSQKILDEIIDKVNGGVLKLEKTKSIRIPNQSIAILSKDRTQQVLPADVDPLGTNLKSVVLAEAPSKTPKGTVPAPIDVPNSARLEEAQTTDVLSTPAIATGAAAALTAAQLVDEPEDAMDTQMQDLTRPREQVGREVPGLRTKYGRPVYETDEGMVSEQSVTLQVAPDEVINIPSIHDGVRYNRDELRDMYLRGDIQATSRHSDIESAVAAAQTRSDEAFSSVPFDPGTVDDPFDAERTDLFAGQTEDPPADDTGLRIEVRPRPEFEQTDELFNQQRGML
jgi:hypothetical protein